MKALYNTLRMLFSVSKIISNLISDFYSQAHEKNESKDMFVDDLQVLVQKIIARKLEFRKDANEQLKSQYAHELNDQYYVANSTQYAAIFR